MSPSSLAGLDVRAALDGDVPERIETEAQRHATVAIVELVKVIRAGKSDAARAAACNTILDRGYGRPAVDIGVDMVLPFLGKAPSKSTLSEVRAAAQRYARLAIEVLNVIATSSESESARVTAARSLLDRGLGTVAVARMSAKDKAAAPPVKPQESSWDALVSHH